MTDPDIGAELKFSISNGYVVLRISVPGLNGWAEIPLAPEDVRAFIASLTSLLTAIESQGN